VTTFLHSCPAFQVEIVDGSESVGYVHNVWQRTCPRRRRRLRQLDRAQRGLRSRKCGNFDLWPPVPKFPFLVRFLLFAVSCATP